MCIEFDTKEVYMSDDHTNYESTHPNLS